ELEGVMIKKPEVHIFGSNNDDQPSFVVSQPWFDPADLRDPFPTEREIEEFLVGHRFRKNPMLHLGWTRDEDNIDIVDIKPDNFIRADDGLWPIDVVVRQRPDEQFARKHVIWMSTFQGRGD